MSARLDLLPDSPVVRIDRAIALVRRGGMPTAVAAWSAGALPALAVLVGFWLERIEGVTSLRPLLAAALVGAFGLRAVLLAGVCRRYVLGFWPAATFPPRAGRPLAVLRTAFVVAAGLVPWGAAALALTVLGPLGPLLLVPFLGFRGLVAPGWLARAACTEEAGMRALFGTAVDHGPQRGEGFVVESLLSVGVLGLTVNLLLAFAAVLFLFRALLGVDLALLDQFLSFRNVFALLGSALLALVLVEPLRAALAAIAHVDVRSRRDGLDVQAAIEAAVAHASKGRRRAATAAAALLALACTTRALAQESPVDSAPPGAPSADADLARDAETRARALRILEGPAYEEFADQRGRGLRELLEHALELLLDLDEPPAAEPVAGAAALPLPGPGVFLALGGVFALAVAAYLVARREPPTPSPPDASRPAERADDPRERAPSDWLARAAAHASAGQHREALRALYLATLVALDRQRALRFDPTLTNWQYLRQLRDGAVRSDFRELTRIFDHKWYGHEAADAQDFELCRMLAERMIQRAERTGSEP